MFINRDLLLFICMLLFYMDSITCLEYLGGDGILKNLAESCFITGLVSNSKENDPDGIMTSNINKDNNDNGEINQVLSKLAAVFMDDNFVHIGLIEKESFLWPDGSKPDWDARFHHEAKSGKIVVFPRVLKDLTCLLEKPAKIIPKFYVYKGYFSLGPILDFVNTYCNTFRTEFGSITPEGIHRTDILHTLFSVGEISKLTMGRLYRSLNNSLNSTFSWSETETDDSEVSSNTCSTGSTECNKSETETDDSEVSSNTCSTGSTECNKSETNHDTKKYSSTQSADSNLGKRTDSTELPTCGRISMPSKEDFFRKYLKKSRPVIIEGAIGHWKAMKKWTTEYLRNRYGNEDMHIKLAPLGEFEGVEKAELWDNYKTFKVPNFVKNRLKFPDLVVVRPATLNLKFSDFLDFISNSSRNKNVSAYLEYSSIPQYLPQLEKDIEEFSFVKNLLERRHLNIWLSDGNTLGKLHFDPFDNLLCQLRGKKQVVLFEPHHNLDLYEAHIPEALLGFNKTTRTFRRKELKDSTSMVMSPVDILKPDFKRFPRFANVHPLNCTLSEGDVLFMPAFWWHEVQSFPNETEARNLAVNFWYEPFLTKQFPCPECKLDVNLKYYRHLLINI